MKQNAVQNLVNKTLENKLQVENVVGMENPFHYRNKVQYPVGLDKSGKPVTGIFANRAKAADTFPVDTSIGAGLVGNAYPFPAFRKRKLRRAA